MCENVKLAQKTSIAIQFTFHEYAETVAEMPCVAYDCFFSFKSLEDSAGLHISEVVAIH